jgi:hypothetical protein
MCLIPEKNNYAPLQIVFIARNARKEILFITESWLKMLFEKSDIKFYCIGNFVETEPVINLGRLLVGRCYTKLSRISIY